MKNQVAMLSDAVMSEKVGYKTEKENFIVHEAYNKKLYYQSNKQIQLFASIVQDLNQTGLAK